jgi:hypothetical protein
MGTSLHVFLCSTRNLMIGRNALLVAKEHGHRPLTMLTVYAACSEGAPESDIRVIRRARNPVNRRTICQQDGTADCRPPRIPPTARERPDILLPAVYLERGLVRQPGSWHLRSGIWHWIRHQRSPRVGQVVQMAGEIMAERAGPERCGAYKSVTSGSLLVGLANCHYNELSLV